LEDLTVWGGEGGQTYFYQSELPYDADQANFGDKVCGEKGRGQKQQQPALRRAPLTAAQPLRASSPLVV
jgi:hypothetical protein